MKTYVLIVYGEEVEAYICYDFPTAVRKGVEHGEKFEVFEIPNTPIYKS